MRRSDERLRRQRDLGAGAGDIGVAGAVAINIVNNTSQALIETGASVAAGGGDVTVTSLNNSTDLTFAEPAGAATGDSLGVGASLALNIITDTTLVRDPERGRPDRRRQRHGHRQLVPDNRYLGTERRQRRGGSRRRRRDRYRQRPDDGQHRLGPTALNASGDLTISATGSFSVNSLADAASEAERGVGIGASVVVNVTQDSFLAELDRSVTAGGAVSVTGDGTASSQATAIASEQGASGDDGTADDDSENQSSFAHDEGASVPALPSANSEMSSPSSSATSESGGSDGETSLGIAAAVAVNVLNSPPPPRSTTVSR